MAGPSGEICNTSYYATISTSFAAEACFSKLQNSVPTIFSEPAVCSFTSYGYLNFYCCFETDSGGVKFFYNRSFT